MEKLLILNHIAAFSIGVILDFVVGDPYSLPHPIRLIGTLINKLDKVFMGEKVTDGVNKKTENDRRTRNYENEKKKGILCVIIVIALTLLFTSSIIILAYYINRVLGIVVEAIATSYVLAAKSLKTESMKVYKAVSDGDIDGARYAVSMIVGRDTEVLNESGIIKAAVETVAENTSDGVIAPMFYLIIGGPILGMIYKSINTMDSMIAYHNDRYEYFGKCAAKLDDIVNYFPARLSAILMIIAAYLGKEFDGNNAKRIFLRDRFNHKSPNSAQTESVCAGALNVQLAGDAYYFGKKVSKPYIGDCIRNIENEDIKRVNRLMYSTTLLLVFFGEAFMLLTLLVL